MMPRRTSAVRELRSGTEDDVQTGLSSEQQADRDWNRLCRPAICSFGHLIDPFQCQPSRPAASTTARHVSAATGAAVRTARILTQQRDFPPPPYSTTTNDPGSQPNTTVPESDGQHRESSSVHTVVVAEIFPLSTDVTSLMKRDPDPMYPYSRTASNRSVSASERKTAR